MIVPAYEFARSEIIDRNFNGTLGLGVAKVVCLKWRRHRSIAAADHRRTGGKRGVTVVITFHGKHFQLNVHHPIWLWFAVLLAFFFVALWATPIG